MFRSYAMDIVDQLRAFVATARTGSFTGGADQLGVSNRLTSKYVAELEGRLAVRLFQRTTRRLGLTPAGEDLLARAPALLDELDALLTDVAEAPQGLTGTLRISSPINFGDAYVTPMLGRFAQAHPGLALDVRFDDRYVDLARDGIDLAFRIGGFDQSTLKVRRLGSLLSVLVASPAYLAEHGAPNAPADLAHHICIVDTNRRDARRWVFKKAGSRREANVQGRFLVNSARAATALALQGLGITYVPRFVLDGALESGALVRLLPDYAGEGAALGAVYLEGRTMPRKVRALIDFAAQDIRQSLVVGSG
ncbi:MAG: LysR family transcriptional regulator [Burkholderiaceae bacterium]